MIVKTNKNINRKYVIGGSGLLDSAFKFLVKTFTSQGAKQLASTAAKEIGKTALDAAKTVAVDAGKQLINKIINPPNPSKRVEEIVNKYTANGSAVDIQDLVKKINGSGLKRI